jgi:DNA-binding NarL/FixJ family response regulator
MVVLIRRVPVPDDRPDAGAGQELAIRVLLVEHDPLSRHVLQNALRGARQIRLVEGSLSAAAPVESLSLREVDIVVLSMAQNDPAALSLLHLLATTHVRVLVLGFDWTRQSLEVALGAGAAGCVAKTTEMHGLAAAVHAVASGHVVMSPELLEIYVGLPEVATPRNSDGELAEQLTSRELEVLGLLTDGLSTAEVAARLGVSFATVKSHVSHVLQKLGVRSRVQAVLIAKELGLKPKSTVDTYQPGRANRSIDTVR